MRLIPFTLALLALATVASAQSQRAYERANDNAAFKRNSQRQAIAVPEPMTLTMVGLGLLTAGLWARRRSE